jgi:hypothetical protein
VTDNNEIDRLATIAPFEDFAVDLTERFRSTPTNITSLLAGPESLRRSIVWCLEHSVTRPTGRDAYRERVRANRVAIATAGLCSDDQVFADHLIEFNDTVHRSLLADIPAQRPHLFVDALPAAGKSTIMLGLLTASDVVVTPTNHLADKWRRDLRAAGKTSTRVFTQHQLLLDPVVGTRLLLIDEAPLFEVAHINALARFASRTVCIGDSSQIRGFHLRPSIMNWAFGSGDAKFYIRAPFSLGLPAPVLRIGQRLGFVPQDAITYNRSGRLEVISANAPDLTPDPDSQNICFNRRYRDLNTITAHESQGSRYRLVQIRCRADEAHFFPYSGHFWTALTRSTGETRLALSTAAYSSLRSGISYVAGTQYSDLASVDSFNCNPPTHLLIDDERCLRGELSASLARYTRALESPLFSTRISDADSGLVNPVPTNIRLPVSTVSAALRTINGNFEEISYFNATDELSLAYGPAKNFVSLKPDLLHPQQKTTSVLALAGVPFIASDSKTELHTIAVRYLTNAPPKIDDPLTLANRLVDAFHRAYVSSAVTSYSPLSPASAYDGWLKKRSNLVFRPSYDCFAEARLTTTYVSFLKPQCKAKNELGYSLTIEKGQTIAASSEQYNSIMCGYGRELTQALQQVLDDDVILDIGLTETDFAARVAHHQFYAEDNTQIDLTSQDTTHNEAFVLALITMLRLYTSITPEHERLLLAMRSQFTVKARNFFTEQGVTYSQNYTLPSGDPFTLIANCLHEAMGTAFVFDLRSSTRGPCVIKGDDQYYKLRLHIAPIHANRMAELGIKMKIVHGLPPFIVGRFILPDNSVTYDPIKVAAKYSIKSYDPQHYATYCRAIADQLAPQNYQQREWTIQYAALHHPHMPIEDIETLYTFAHALTHLDNFLAFQNPASVARYSVISSSTDCARTALKVLGVAAHLLPPRTLATGTQVAASCRAGHIPYRYINARLSVATLTAFALEHPDHLIFDNNHAVTYAAARPTGIPLLVDRVFSNIPSPISENAPSTDHLLLPCPTSASVPALAASWPITRSPSTSETVRASRNTPPPSPLLLSSAQRAALLCAAPQPSTTTSITVGSVTKLRLQKLTSSTPKPVALCTRELSAHSISPRPSTPLTASASNLKAPSSPDAPPNLPSGTRVRSRAGRSSGQSTST